MLPSVEDDGWFFDTELLFLAERIGLRIHQVPVDWVDDPDTRVDIVRTARADLAGIVRLLRGRAAGRLRIAELRTCIGRQPLAGGPSGAPALALVHAATALPTRTVELAVLVGATALRFLLLRTWVFRAYGATGAQRSVECSRVATSGRLPLSAVGVAEGSSSGVGLMWGYPIAVPNRCPAP